MSIIFALAIKHDDINSHWAKGAAEDSQHIKAIDIKSLLSNHVLLFFLISILLFHLTNSALLPVVIQKIIKVCPYVTAKTIPLWSTSCIIMAELVMIFSAILAGKWANAVRKNIFLICFILVALRAFLFAIIMQPYLLVSTQFLDGLSAGMFSVIGLTMLDDLVYGTGRFNLSQGLFNAFTAIGIALSNYLAGISIDWLSFSPTCIIFALVIIASVSAKLIPETKNRKFIYHKSNNV